jgi:hypothetical protein
MKGHDVTLPQPGAPAGTGRIARFLVLTWPERRVFLAAFVLLPLFKLGLRVAGLRRVQSWLERPRQTAGGRDGLDIKRIGALVNSAAHHGLGPANCLTRSLYLVWLLRRRGVNAELRIGVRMNGASLDAHAWVEYAGVPINDREDIAAEFAAFDAPVSSSLFTSS